MKKLVSILLAASMGISVCAMAACNKNNRPPVDTPAGIIRLRSNEEQDMQIGDIIKVVFDAKYNDVNAKDDVKFTSSDEKVVTVDAYGNITAVGAGTATVTLAFKQDETIKATVTCKVTKTFFMVKPGYYNGSVDPTTAEASGWVHIKPGEQTQLLVSEHSENWYFKTELEHTGDTGADSSGRWGVGSFLVDDTHPIGDVMAWFGFQPTSHATKSYTPYVGGWKVQSGGMDREIQLMKEAMADADFAEFEIIRHGIDHYCTVTVGEQVAKYVYSCPSFDGVPTYPGVYSQKQEVYVSNFEASSDMEVVMQKLNNFQIAESVVIEGVTDTLYAGSEYDVVASVKPDTTYDKGVEFSLKQPVEGVTITKGGKLTVGADVTGEVTVVASAVSADVSAEKTYTVKAKTASAHTLFDTENIVTTESGNYTLGTDSVTYTKGGKAYLPFEAKGEKWAVSFETNLTAGKFGVLGATNGYCDYVSAVVESGAVVYGKMAAEQDKIECSTAATNTVTVVRDGSFYLVVVNGRLVERFYSATAGGTMPVLYTDGAVGTINGIVLATEEADVDAVISQYPYTVGKYVTDNGDGSYTIAQKDFGSADDMNWPPVNNYVNGLKFAQTTSEDYTVEFKMSNIKPMSVGGKTDGKILIYLRSESKTASLQFCFKSGTGGIKVTFCPNLNDATWTEYDATELNLMEGEVTVKVVKTATHAELYINGTRVYEGNTGLNNSGYWTADTLFTPGIGTYCCGVTVSDVSITVGTN